jgi:hypothetical protein
MQPVGARATEFEECQNRRNSQNCQKFSVAPFFNSGIYPMMVILAMLRIIRYG